MTVAANTLRGLVLLVILTSGVGCGVGASHWPPAVGSKTEIESLPISQPDIRGIGIGDRELQLIAQRFPRLNYLFLNSGSKISDQGLSSLAKSSRLHQLVILDGSRISDRGIAVLAGLPSLRELIIRNAPSITDASLVILGKKKELELLNLEKCPELSDSAKSDLKRSLPNCQVLFE